MKKVIKKQKKPPVYEIILAAFILLLSILWIFYNNGFILNNNLILISELLPFIVFTFLLKHYLKNYNSYLITNRFKFNLLTFIKENIKIFICTIFLIILIIGLYIFLNKSSLEQAKDSTVMIEVYDMNNELVSTGSGFCVDKGNLIVTNYHVIEGAYKIKIITDNKEEYDVNNVVIFDYKTDLAIIEVNTNLKPIKIGKPSSIKTGKKVTAIGSPLGELNTVSTGIISNAENDKGIQISAPISHGSSGGVLLDSNYKAIGITYSGIEAGQNLNYAIDIKYLVKMVESLDNKEYVTVVETDSISWTEAMNNKKTFVNRCYLQNDADDLSFAGCHSRDENYYSVESMKVFYDITSIYMIYDNLMLVEYPRTYGLDYKLLSDDKKIYAADIYSQYDFKDDISSTSIYDMKPYNIIYSIAMKDNSIFANDNIKFKISNILADLESGDSATTCFNKINKKWLETGEKIMFDLLYCGISLDDLDYSDRKYFVDYIVDLGMSQSKNEEIFKYFGYTVSNGRVYY